MQGLAIVFKYYFMTRAHFLVGEYLMSFEKFKILFVGIMR